MNTQPLNARLDAVEAEARERGIADPVCKGRDLVFANGLANTYAKNAFRHLAEEALSRLTTEEAEAVFEHCERISKRAYEGMRRTA